MRYLLAAAAAFTIGYGFALICRRQSGQLPAGCGPLVGALVVYGAGFVGAIDAYQRSDDPLLFVGWSGALIVGTCLIVTTLRQLLSGAEQDQGAGQWSDARATDRLDDEVV